jgi:hypothetical protein
MGGIIVYRVKQKFSENTCLSVNVLTANFIWTILVVNPGLRREKPNSGT